MGRVPQLRARRVVSDALSRLFVSAMGARRGLPLPVVLGGSLWPPRGCGLSLLPLRLVLSCSSFGSLPGRLRADQGLLLLD